MEAELGARPAQRIIIKGKSAPEPRDLVPDVEPPAAEGHQAAPAAPDQNEERDARLISEKFTVGYPSSKVNL